LNRARIRRVPGAGRQRGWVGLVLLLAALVIVAFLAKDALKQYGVQPGAATAAKATSPAQAQQGAIDAMPSAPSSGPSTAIERARSLEDTIKSQGDEQARRMP